MPKIIVRCPQCRSRFSLDPEDCPFFCWCGAKVDARGQLLSAPGGLLHAKGGPGTELIRLLHGLGADPDSSCDCYGRAAQMDEWGVAGCREHRAEIVAWLAEAAYKQWVTTQLKIGGRMAQEPWFNPLDPLGSLVDEAIRRAAALDPHVGDEQEMQSS